MIKFRESGHPVFRATSPFSRGFLIHFCADGDTIETVLRTIISVNQLMIYGAVSDLWRILQLSNRKTCCSRAIWSTFRASRFIGNDTCTFDWDSCTRKSFAEAQRTSGKASTTRSIDKFCTDAGFLTTVDVGQYFMTKDTEQFSQSTEPVACRGYTLPSDENSTAPKGWIRGNTKIGPVLVVTTSYYKVNTEWISELNLAFAFARGYKAKAQPRKPSTTCSSWRTLHILERKWIDVEPGAQFDQAYPVAKRINTLLQHGELLQEEDGAIEFWRLKDDLRNKFEYSQYWSDDVWKSKMAGDGGNKKRFQYCTDPSGQVFLYLRALQGHSGRNPIDPTLQDNVLIPNNFFEYIYHIGCAIHLHSITNSGLIAVGQNSCRERQTDGILSSRESHA